MSLGTRRRSAFWLWAAILLFIASIVVFWVVPIVQGPTAVEIKFGEAPNVGVR